MRVLGGPPRHVAVGAAGPLPQTAYSIQLAIVLFTIFLSNCITNTYGGCEFPSHWSGKWFQSGFGILQMNRTSIDAKGECFDSQGDKFVIYDRLDDCYRCMVIHEKHHSVLQYKETYCDQKASLAEMCYSITGDAALYSMFRKWPEPKAVPCPFFKQAPFTFTYNRGSGECANPPSRAETCTDNSRLVLKYQACPDIQSTESNVEELVCVATWKEGSTRYLVGKLNQLSRRTTLPSDEDQYRCFIYERVSSSSGPNKNIVTYHVAQSGDATCNGVQSAVEGSRTIQLTQADSHHGRCSFPSWITDHHTWLSLDHSRIYKFSLRNATLRITNIDKQHKQQQQQQHQQQQQQQQQKQESPIVASATDRDSLLNGHLNRHHAHEDRPLEEQQQQHTSTSASIEAHSGASFEEDGKVRLVCHSILQAVDNRHVQIVAHVTAGCDSGYVCMVFHKRDASVIEIQQSDVLHENTDDACAYFNAATTPYTTLIAPALHPTACPHPGRYTVLGAPHAASAGAADDAAQQAAAAKRKKKKRRQASETGAGGPAAADLGTDTGVPSADECLSHDYEALAVGCSTHEQLEFKSSCLHQSISAYTCHGSWQENNTYYVIASPVARKSTDALRYCLVYTFDGGNSTQQQQQQQQQQLHQQQQAAGSNSGSIISGTLNYYGTSSRTTPGPLVPGIPGANGPPSFILQSGMVMRLSGLSDSCHRHITPGSSGLWAFNFTTNGPCNRFGETGSATRPQILLSTLLLVLVLAINSIGPFR